MQEMFTEEIVNRILCDAGMWPLTTSKCDYPALGMVVDWDPASGQVYAVVEIPVIFSHRN